MTVIINETRNKVKENAPLIHCITNPISITQSANAVLAIGGRPMMAEHPMEVGEITPTADALLLNLGNLTDVRMKSMMIAAKAARKKGIPTVIDAVGVACSTHRREYAGKLIAAAKPMVIKGNYSEINALFDKDYRSAGVDADGMLGLEAVTRSAAELAENYNAVVLASGAVDVVTDGRVAVSIKNGSPQLAKITGTGCMLGALCAAYCSVTDGLNASLTACAVLGISGQLAETQKGNGSFFAGLMDGLTVLSAETIEKYLNTEMKRI